jgi:HK97 family phage portal protein
MITRMKQWLTERRSLANPLPQMLEVFSAGPTAAGVMISPEKALSVPAVFSCIQVLAQDTARTPIKFRRKIAEDTYIDATDHDLYEILGTLPNPEQTAYGFKYQMMFDLLMHGRAFAEIVRVEGRVVALWRLDPRQIRVDRDEQRRKRWTFSGYRGEAMTWIFNASTPPIFELTQETPLIRCRDLIGNALALQTYAGKYFANGATPAGALLIPQQLNEQARKSLRDSWLGRFRGAERSHGVAILDGDVKYQPFASENDKSQMNETVLTINTAIAGTFRVPTWKIGDLSKATYSNMEYGSIDYVSSTLDPYFQCWEDAIRRDLLTNRQYNQFSVTFDRSALIRSDVQSQHAALATGIQAGFYSQNDARRALGLNPIPDGDTYMVNSALVPIADAVKTDQGEDDAAA